jgi:hypothetical protein
MKPILTLLFLLTTASLLFAEEIHLKNGKVIQAESAKAQGETLVIKTSYGEVEVGWQELAEADGRRFFPKIYGALDRKAREAAERIQRERQTQEAARLEAERQANQKAEQERASIMEEYRIQSDAIQKQLDLEKQMEVKTFVGRVVQLVNGGFHFHGFTSRQVEGGLLNLSAPRSATLGQYYQDVERLKPVRDALDSARNGNFESAFPYLNQLDTVYEVTPRFIVGYPEQKQKDFVDGQPLVIRARRDGNYEFKTITGFSKTVEKWVYWALPEVRLPQEPNLPTPRVTQPKPPPQPQQTACIVCRGSGWNGVVKCTPCNGTGYVKRK